MSEYDPMKDNTSSNDPNENKNGTANDAYSASDRSYTYGSSADQGGRGYTNPDGSHGFIYNPRESAAENKNRRYRGALIAVSAVLVTLVLGTGCFFGAWMAARSLNEGSDKNDPAETDSKGEVGTSDGLVIEGDSEGLNGEETDGELNVGTSAGGDSQTPSNGEANQMGTETVPPMASIEKLPAEREDTNGDGKAEIETDANGNVLTSAGENILSTATVVARVAASVVEITTETIVSSGHIGQYITSGAGSGVIISEEGFIVTNNHVIEDANTITVRLNDGTEFSATLIGTDEQTDVAVLWIDAGNYDLTVATLGSSFDLVVGEDIIAIGNPLGSLGGTVTEGIVSATERQISVSGTDMNLLQVSAPINPGNSGGGLFNMAGELVGIVNAKMSSEEIEGLGFAIPIDTAYEVILELIDHGYVRGRAALGFTVVDVTSVQTAMRYFNSFYTGVYVYDQSHDVLQYGDLILAVDGTEISSSDELSAAIKGKSVGDTIELIVYRSKEQVTLTVTLVEYVPESLQPAA